MPVEGQWDRANTPLRPRDRVVLVVVPLVLALVAVGAYLTHPSSHSDTGCVSVVVPSTMGGASIRRCGAAARTFCLDQSSLGNAAEQCSRLGYKTRRSG